MANMLGRLGVVLGLDAAEFVSGINKAEKNLKQFAEGAIQYGKIGATALTAMSIAAIKFADDIAEVAEKNEVAIDTVLKLRSALESSGGSADAAGILLSSFTKAIDTAATGSFEAQKSFKDLGISLKDIGTLSQEQLLGKALKGLQSIEDPITQNAKAMELFNKAAKGVALDSFAQQMQSTSTATRQQIEAVKAGAETWGNFEKIIRKLQLSFVEGLGPSLKAINNSLGNETYNRISMLGKVFDFLARNVYSTYKAMQSIVVLFEQLAGQSVIAQTYGESAAGMAQTAKLKQETERRLAALRQELKDFEDFQKGNTGIRTDVYPKGGRPKVGEEVVRQTVLGVDSKAEALRAKAEAERKKQEAEAEALLKRRLALTAQGYEEEQRAIKESADELAKYVEEQAKAAQSQSEYFRLSNQQLDRDKEMMLLEKTNLNLRSEELNYAQQILSIRNKYADRIYEIEKQENLTREKKDEFMQREIELRDRSIQQAKEALDITRQSREGTMADGFTKGFDEFVRDMPTRMEMGKTAFNSLMNSMDSALRQFVQTGKINFKDLVRSMIQEMIYLESKAKMMDMFKSMKSGGDGGGGIMDMLGGLFGGGGGGGAMGGPANFDPFGLVGFANGGSPPVGQASIVGERGPELFVPRTAGTIIPNNQLSGMGGGSTVNYNGPYIASMNAIDTQSGTQFLAKNKNTIWAAYQSANRGVPVSR